jgi:hypothetical protein
MDNIAFLLSLLQDEVQNSSILDKENQSRKVKKNDATLGSTYIKKTKLN